MRAFIFLIFFALSLRADLSEAPPFPDYGLIVPSSTASIPYIADNTIAIKKGWNLYGYDKGIDDVNLTFMLNKDSIGIIWAYDEASSKWKAYSPDSKTQEYISNSSIIDTLNSIKPNEGFWINGLIDSNVTIDPNLGIPDEIILIGTSTGDENLSKVGGEFEISISPLDKNQELISDSLTKENFVFENVEIFDLNNIKITTATVLPIELTVTKPKSGFSSANNIILDIDSSGSMSSNDPSGTRKEAAKKIIDLLSYTEMMAVMDFGVGADNGFDQSRLLQPFTNDINGLKNSIDLVEQSGGTPMFKSMIDAISYLNTTQYGSKTLIVFTDGEASDNSYYDEAINQAKSSYITIHTIGLGYDIDANMLKDIASQTGGVYGHASDNTQLENVFTAIGTGAIKGKVTIRANGTFEGELASGEYKIIGTIKTTVYGISLATVFEIPIQVE